MSADMVTRDLSGYAAQSSYPAVPDTRSASDEACAFFESFFAAKNSHDVNATMQHFSPRVVTYTDAILGWPLDSFDAIEGCFHQYMPTWPDTALSYPTRILGGTGSALVAFTDTPELFGGELRILGAVDFEEGKIVRWVDYWDSTDFDNELYRKLRTPDDAFPVDFKEHAIAVHAAPTLVDVATALQRALAAADAHGVSELLSYDAVYEDMALRVQVLGRSAVERYLAATLNVAPYGKGSTLRHIVGGPAGGGVEWITAAGNTVAGGISALEVDHTGRVSRLTTVYDGRRLSDTDRQSLAQPMLTRRSA
jgi:hypothetical protein